MEATGEDWSHPKKYRVEYGWVRCFADFAAEIVAETVAGDGDDCSVGVGMWQDCVPERKVRMSYPSRKVTLRNGK